MKPSIQFILYITLTTVIYPSNVQEKNPHRKHALELVQQLENNDIPLILNFFCKEIQLQLPKEIKKLIIGHCKTELFVAPEFFNYWLSGLSEKEFAGFFFANKTKRHEFDCPSYDEEYISYKEIIRNITPWLGHVFHDYFLQENPPILLHVFHQEDWKEFCNSSSIALNNFKRKHPNIDPFCSYSNSVFSQKMHQKYQCVIGMTIHHLCPRYNNLSLAHFIVHLEEGDKRINYIDMLWAKGPIREALVKVSKQRDQNFNEELTSPALGQYRKDHIVAFLFKDKIQEPTYDKLFSSDGERIKSNLYMRYHNVAQGIMPCLSTFFELNKSNLYMRAHNVAEGRIPRLSRFFLKDFKLKKWNYYMMFLKHPQKESFYVLSHYLPEKLGFCKYLISKKSNSLLAKYFTFEGVENDDNSIIWMTFFSCCDILIYDSLNRCMGLKEFGGNYKHIINSFTIKEIATKGNYDAICQSQGMTFPTNSYFSIKKNNKYPVIPVLFCTEDKTPYKPFDERPSYSYQKTEHTKQNPPKEQQPYLQNISASIFSGIILLVDLGEISKFDHNTTLGDVLKDTTSHTN